MHAESPSSVPASAARAGNTVLSLCAAPLAVPILRAHAVGPLRLPELRERVGGPAQTTLRGHVANLRAIGALSKVERGGMPYAIENELTPAGRGILSVADVLEAWLARAPQGPIALGSEPAKGVIRALTAGWSSTILRAIAARPLSLTELDGRIAHLSYPAIERRLAAMRAVRQVEQLPEQRGGRPYTVTPWLRQAVAPILAAGRCECRHLLEDTTATPADVEAAFLLAVPLVELDDRLGGSCLLGVDTASAGEPRKDPRQRLAGVHVDVEAGRVRSCVSEMPSPEPPNWTIGSASGWLDAIIEQRSDKLRVGGAKPELGRLLAKGLHEALFLH